MAIVYKQKLKETNIWFNKQSISVMGGASVAKAVDYFLFNG
jgi:hypothetical protein